MKLTTWPPQSTELNLMELVWDELDNKVRVQTTNCSPSSLALANPALAKQLHDW